MSKKPNFLERLTGAVPEDEENGNPEISETKPKMKDEKQKIRTAVEEPEGGEWLPESEGQLTIDVYQTPTHIVIKSTIAGVKSEDLDITITNDMVTIRGQRQKDEEIKTEDYYYQECYWGTFSRSVILPVDVQADEAEANLKNGILTIRLPKIEKIKTKKIRVSTE
jgi:HSP20 family protein